MAANIESLLTLIRQRLLKAKIVDSDLKNPVGAPVQYEIEKVYHDDIAKLCDAVEVLLKATWSRPNQHDVACKKPWGEGACDCSLRLKRSAIEDIRKLLEPKCDVPSSTPS